MLHQAFEPLGRWSNSGQLVPAGGVRQASEDALEPLFESADKPKPLENVRQSSGYKYPTRRTAPASAVAELGVVRRSSRHPRTQPYMTNSETNVTSSSSGFESLVIRASGGEAGASALAASRTRFESSALLGFGHAATLPAMEGFVPVCASLSGSAAQRRSTSPVRESARLAGSFLPTPQPHSAASPSAHQHSLPLAAAQSAAVTFTRRFAATRQRWRKSDGTPNHALQRTAPRVTVAAISSLEPSSPSHLFL